MQNKYILYWKLCRIKWMKKTKPINSIERISLFTQFDPYSLGALTCGVELNKLHVLVRESGSGCHGSAVSCTGVGRGTWEIGSSISTTRQYTLYLYINKQIPIKSLFSSSHSIYKNVHITFAL